MINCIHDQSGTFFMDLDEKSKTYKKGHITQRAILAGRHPELDAGSPFVDIAGRYRFAFKR
ncbi:MAG TPA: hypothetical protein VJ915_10565 [Balneolaceae bacterium]|nr:hypothetical protein [Balneolaceae bacterium]